MEHNHNPSANVSSESEPGQADMRPEGPKDGDDENEETPSYSITETERLDHMRELIKMQSLSYHFLENHLSEQNLDTAGETLEEDQIKSLLVQAELIKKMMHVFDHTSIIQQDQCEIEVRLHDVSYRVPVNESSRRIPTVYNQSIFYTIYKGSRRLYDRYKRRNMTNDADVSPSKYVLKNINLVLNPGKMYLVLGPPGSGKTSLLRAVASLLPESNKKHGPAVEGRIEYNGLPAKNDLGIIVSNTISYVGQIDQHAPRLTVEETFDFAFQCKSGGTHLPSGTPDTPDVKDIIDKLDEDKFRLKFTMEMLGLSQVADTFVGNSDVRGVSGGQRRRVSVGEMLMSGSPIFCGDEISTGLDAASTFQIIQTLKHFTKVTKKTRIISLLQPSPETYSLFDEVVLLSEGEIIYAGPIDQAEEYFTSLGYKIPGQMDVADFLQTISTPYGDELFHPTNEYDEHHTPEKFVEIFRASQLGQRIQNKLASSLRNDWRDDISNSSSADEETGISSNKGKDAFKKRYQNSFVKSMWLNFKRHFTIWIRDRRYIVALAIKNLVMGMSVGAVFFQTDSVVSLFGVLFQGMLFIMLGSMTSAPAQLDDRIIYYKHRDANLYPTFSFVIGRAVSLIPQSIMDCFMFGTMIYWMVGLAPTAVNFFIFIAILVVFTLTMSQMLSIFASISPTRSMVQGIAAFIMLLLILFCGFIIYPDVIPNYYTWLYWWNPLAWAYRGLLVNEFTSSKYDIPLPNTQTIDITVGEAILISKGFVDSNGNAYGQEWIGFCFAYLVPYIIICVFLTGLCLRLVRVEGGNTTKSDIATAANEDEDEERNNFDLPFIPVALTFENMEYTVKTSTGGGTLKLLNEVSGVFKPGRMCALMGSSGAGKTTLMDVIALRKTTGTIAGEVRLNGHLQEIKAFRRCSGYVEQFDVQSPELTVRETILFSARLRLDSNNPETRDDEQKLKFVDSIIRMLELTSEENLPVGSDEEGGLSFEQKKRLSIAVELAASPSIIFLDEPTSGLDARAALLVMKSLKRISNTGRTVCATIHQPSSAVFEMFDDLLLMKKGGITAYFGELGEGSSKLINYFESRGAKPIEHGENPGTWMLNVIVGSFSQSVEDPDQKSLDYAEAYRTSDEYSDLMAQINELKTTPDESKKITYENQFATTFSQRNKLMNNRLVLIYWRSPTYNLGRLTLSVCIAFILASVFITNRNPEEYTETEIASIISTIFISFIIIGVLSITSVLPVMLSIRDIFYRHRASGMLNHSSLALALGVAEKRFILLSGALFCVVFYTTMGLDLNIRKFAAFWGFFTFNLAIYSYFGQAFMCLVRGMATAQILASVFIGLNNFFSGLIVRPQYLTGFWQTTYWITPGHYVFEGLVVSQFYDDNRPVVAYQGSSFYIYLGCKPEAGECIGTVYQFVESFFGGRFQKDHLIQDALVLGLYLVFARVLTFIALKRFNYVST